MAATPRTVDHAQRDGLAAGLHDPLWSLGRQMQFGEATASLRGTPIAVDLAVRAAPLARLGDAGCDPAAVPAEAALEREPVETAAVAERVASGRLLARLLDDAGAGGTRTALLAQLALAADVLPPPGGDPSGHRRARPLVGRVIDGHRVRAALGPDGAVEPVPLPPDEQDAARDVFARWAARYDARAVGAPDTWVPQRLEHVAAQATSAADGIVLAAVHPGGDLEWSSFDLATRADSGQGATEPVSRTMLPAPVTFPGMPSPELFAFEEGRVNLAALAAAGSPDPDGEPERPTRALGVADAVLLWFATVYGDDWFLLPVDLPAGSISTVVRLTVRDTFGRTVAVPHVSDVDGPGSPWRMFGPAGADDLLVVAPARGGVQDGEPMEEVLVLHDEVANLGWAVERRVPDLLGRSRDRREERGPPTPGQAPDGIARYVLGTPPPPHWLPLVPADDPTMLQIATLPGTDGPARPLGRLLADPQLRLHREEVSREGQQVVRRARRARSADGGTHVWTGRAAVAGAGEGSSGLAFDVVR